jgi:hypothetical protein
MIVTRLYTSFYLSAIASTLFQGVVYYGLELLLDSCRTILADTSFDLLVWAATPYNVFGGR